MLYSAFCLPHFVFCLLSSEFCILYSVFCILASYLFGSIPTGLWLGLRLRGIDIRQHGSNNIGATNTMRVLGWKLGVIALAGDISKGVLAVLLFARISDWAHAPLACGVAAVVGHTASVFVRFRGGKGVATGAGVFLALAPIPTLIAATVFALLLALTRMVSAGSISAAVALTIAVYALDPHWPLRVVTALVAALVIWRHRSNIQRILTGRENRIGPKRPPPTESPD